MSTYFSTNSLQAPAVYVEIMGVQFGLHEKDNDVFDITQIRPSTPRSLIKYPNLITAIEAKRISDADLNIYSITLKYQPGDNEDPSYIDKLLSANSTQNGGKIVIAYGDGSGEGFFRDKLEALVTKYTMEVNLEASTFTYTLIAQSVGGIYYLKKDDGSIVNFEFPDRSDVAVSSVIREIYNDTTYGLNKAFPGGIYIEDLHINDITDDNRPDAVLRNATIPGGSQNPLEYLKTLVKYMIPITIGTDNASSYVYSFNDKLGGQSFDINRAIGAGDGSYIEEIPIGVEGSPVVSYSFTTDFSSMRAVEYGEVDEANSLSRYYINENGQEVRVDGIANSDSYNLLEIARDQKWWATVSNLPYGLNLVVRSMKRHVPLMSKFKVTIVVKGRVHWVSGIYQLTAIKDKVDNSGYFSEIEMLKIPQSTDIREKLITGGISDLITSNG